MYKKHLIENLEREIVLLKRLGAIVEQKDLDFRPAEKMRTSLELMQYLSRVGGVMCRWLIKNDITPEFRLTVTEHRNTLTIENFSERLDDDLKVMKEYMNMVSEEELLTKEVELPWKEKMILGQAIINAPIKWLTAYRMELFMNLKMNGRPDLGTKEAWVVAPPVEAEAK